MTYAETVDFLFNQLANYHKQGQKAYKPGLDNIRAFCDLIGNPQDKLETIHVAGTNGKGSVCHILASVLQEAGYKVGLFTSPHFIDFRERVKINGKEIPEADVVEFVENHKEFALENGITFFEWTTALALYYFEKENVDIAIIETGLGGRLDSTNVIKEGISIITSIGMDHADMLGYTIESIAKEKAGIIKKGISIIGGGMDSLHPIFIEKAEEVETNLYFSNSKNNFSNYCDIKGDYQRENLNTAYTLLEMGIKEESNLPFTLTNDQIIDGFGKVKENTGLRGRWETISNSPKVIVDIAHNEPAITQVIRQALKHKGKVKIVLGFMSDKEVDNIIHLLPNSFEYYVVSANHIRALPANKLAEKLQSEKLKCTQCDSVEVGMRLALSNSEKSDLILICGSAYVVSEALLEKI